ncbi:MAG TPA: 2-oxoglutarate and iron-dependent oxygenase domain-containing protein [Pseudonocardia sp.]|nr:2-oxoglutarate and iron-dependent oxygenase domain-containing protein [Pseudonocardia sp.]
MGTARTWDGLLDVPIIDISPFRISPFRESGPTAGGVAADRDTIADRDAVAALVDRAAREVGFMQIVGHGIAPAVLDRFTSATDAFFALDLETKNRYRCPPGINRGYSPPKSESLVNSLGLTSPADLFEAINVGVSAADHPGVDLPADDHAPNDYAPNVYPSEVPDFEAAVSAWFAEAGAVARTMTRIFGRALGLGEDYFAAYTDHSLDVLRMNNYRLPASEVRLEPDQLGMGAHTDYGIVTVLWADSVPGLEILDADGRWHPAQPAPGALLVNLGDGLARWTNDEWLSTMHRVAPPRVDGVLVPRRSAAYFHDGNTDAVIECLPSCVRPGRPAAYAPVTIGEHLRAKLAGSRAGQLTETASREAARLGEPG